MEHKIIIIIDMVFLFFCFKQLMVVECKLLLLLSLCIYDASMIYASMIMRLCLLGTYRSRDDRMEFLFQPLIRGPAANRRDGRVAGILILDRSNNFQKCVLNQRV